MVTYSRLHRTLSRWVLNISREGDSTTSLGSLFQCSVTLRVKKFFGSPQLVGNLYEVPSAVPAGQLKNFGEGKEAPSSKGEAWW